MWSCKSIVVINTGLGNIFYNFCNGPVVLFSLVVITFKRSLTEHQETCQVVFDVGFARQYCYLNVTKDENFLGLFAWVWIKAYLLIC